MVKTWSSGQGDDAVCDNCGSVYAVTIHRFPHRDNDSYNCVVCGHLIASWNSTACPSFKLIKRSTTPEGEG